MLFWITLTLFKGSVTSLYEDDIYGSQNNNHVLANGIIGDESESLDQIAQDMGYEDQVHGYDLENDDEVQIHFIRDPFSSFDLNNYALIESDSLRTHVETQN